MFRTDRLRSLYLARCYSVYPLGLKLILNIQQDEYVNAITEGAGARVVVHSQDYMPLPGDEGILVSPGDITSIGMRQVRDRPQRPTLEADKSL